MPKPTLTYAISPVSKNDDDKIGPALQKISQEDPTVSDRNPETKQLTISGQGNVQLGAVIEELKNDYGVSVERFL